MLQSQKQNMRHLKWEIIHKEEQSHIIVNAREKYDFFLNFVLENRVKSHDGLFYGG